MNARGILGLRRAFIMSTILLLVNLFAILNPARGQEYSIDALRQHLKNLLPNSGIFYSIQENPALVYSYGIDEDAALRALQDISTGTGLNLVSTTNYKKANLIAALSDGYSDEETLLGFFKHSIPAGNFDSSDLKSFQESSEVVGKLKFLPTASKIDRVTSIRRPKEDNRQSLAEYYAAVVHGVFGYRSSQIVGPSVFNRPPRLGPDGRLSSIDIAVLKSMAKIKTTKMVANQLVREAIQDTVIDDLRK